MHENVTADALFLSRLEEHLVLSRSLSGLALCFAAMASDVLSALKKGRKVLFFGNGGSAADCQHLAAEMVNRFERDRAAVPAIALTTDTSALTSIANDSTFVDVFSRQLEGLGVSGDVAVAITTSGKSPNVLKALERARALGMITVVLTGAGGRTLAGNVDHLLEVPSSNTARIQEAHIFLGHLLCEYIEVHISRERETEAENAPPAEKKEGSPTFFVHPSSYIDDGVSIGEGTRIWFFCHVQKGARVGQGCILGQNVNIDRDAIVGNNVKIQNNVSVYKGVVVEDDVFLGPSMVFTNVTNPRSHVNRKNEFRDTRVCRGASIGANATIVCGHTIGAYAFVGAGAVVTRDVPPYALVTGAPARIKGWMCQCGVRLSFPSEQTSASAARSDVCGTRCDACGARYQKEGECVVMCGGPDDETREAC